MNFEEWLKENNMDKYEGLLIMSHLELAWNAAIDEAVKAANSFNGCEVVSWKIEELKQ